jgi:hypothetical protein
MFMKEKDVRAVLVIMLGAIREVIATVKSPSERLEEFDATVKMWISKQKDGGENKIC